MKKLVLIFSHNHSLTIRIIMRILISMRISKVKSIVFVFLVSACGKSGGGGSPACVSTGISDGTYTDGAGKTIIVNQCNYSFLASSSVCQTGRFTGNGATLSLYPSYSSCGLSSAYTNCSYTVNSNNIFTIGCPAVSGTFSK